MNPKGTPENLTPWKPGQPGNPQGGSRKVRERVLLRDFIRRLGDQEPEPEEIEELGPKAAGLVRGLIAAQELWMRAMLGDDKAVGHILGIEPRAVELSGELGIELDEEQTELGTALAALSRRRRTNGSGRLADPSPEGDTEP